MFDPVYAGLIHGLFLSLAVFQKRGWTISVCIRAGTHQTGASKHTSKFTHGPALQVDISCHIWEHTSNMQERLAPSAVTHRISTLHPYNTRQQTGLASQQVNLGQIMPGKCTRTENSCDCVQAVMKGLKRCCNYNAAGVRRCSKRQYAEQTRVV